MLSYNLLYRLSSVTFPGSRTVSYGYDDASRRTSITYPGGSNQVTYGYDPSVEGPTASHLSPTGPSREGSNSTT